MFAFDSNILIYAVDRNGGAKRAIALDLVKRAPANTLLLQQVCGEFLNVCRQRGLRSAEDACLHVADWALTFRLTATDSEQLLDAARLAERRKKQFWDMLIVTVAAQAGAVALLSEDIGDGEVIEGVRIVNPFEPANAPLIDDLLTAAMPS